MTFVSVIGVLLSFAAFGIYWGRLTVGKLAILSLLLLAHLAASLYYFSWSQTVAADASGYYFDPYHFSGQPWGLGSLFVTKLCNLLKARFGATYLDCFLLFQSFGFAGLVLLGRIFQEIEEYVVVPDRRGYLALLFLPSVNFWTSAIGKDAPVFMAISLSLWAMLNLRRRYAYFGLALGIMVLFRAHIAMLAAIALAGASFFGSSISFGRKVGLLAFAIVGIWLTAGAVESTFGVDATSVSSVSDYIDKQNATFAADTGNTSLGDAPFVVRVLSLLFRPLFFDAHGLLGIVASIENLAVIFVVLYAIAHWRDLALLFKRVFFVRFAIVFAFVILLLLSIIYYNVGLGLRERVMSYPMIYSALVALWAMRRKQPMAPPAQIGPGLMVGANANTILNER